MQSVSNSVMVALLPTTTDWCNIELPHMTLVYAGELDSLDSKAFNELATKVISIGLSFNPVNLDVLGVETFGKKDEKVDVLRLTSSSDLLTMRKIVDEWNASEFPFNPHATIGPIGTLKESPPSKLTFDRVGLFWGEDSTVLKLGTERPV